MEHKNNHLFDMNDINEKIAFLQNVDTLKRPYVASKLYKKQAPFILSQIAYRNIARYKLPTFFAANCLFSEKSIAQATAEQVAQYKAIIVGKAKKLYSLTGGLGVDDYFFAKNIDSLISYDLDEALNNIVRSNFSALHVKNIERHTQKGEDFFNLNIDEKQNALIYIDPDRRLLNKSNKIITEFSPDIIKLVPELLAFNCTIYLKLPGVTDISWVNANISNIDEIYIIALFNEVKELFIKVSPGAKNSPILTAIHLSKENEPKQYSEEVIKLILAQTKAEKGLYIYEPWHCISKIRLQHIAKPISPNTHLFYTSKTALSKHGKLFMIHYDGFITLPEIQKLLKQKKIDKSAVTARNTKITSAEFSQKLGLKTDDKMHMFIFGLEKKYHFIIAEVCKG